MVKVSGQVCFWNPVWKSPFDENTLWIVQIRQSGWIMSWWKFSSTCALSVQNYVPLGTFFKVSQSQQQNFCDPSLLFVYSLSFIRTEKVSLMIKSQASHDKWNRWNHSTILATNFLFLAFKSGSHFSISCPATNGRSRAPCASFG